MAECVALIATLGAGTLRHRLEPVFGAGGILCSSSWQQYTLDLPDYAPCLYYSFSLFVGFRQGQVGSTLWSRLRNMHQQELSARGL